MGERITQGNGCTAEGRQQSNQDSDDDDSEVVDGSQLWGGQHQVGYLQLEGEFGGDLSPQPSTSAECDHRVSPLDPNMSSAARYSPPPPYSSPVTDMEASLDHPDSMEDLSSSNLPIITSCVSRLSSSTGGLIHPHKLIPSRASAGSYAANSLFVTQSSIPHSQHWVTPNVMSDTEDVVSQDQDFDGSDSPPLRRTIWGTQRGLRNLSGAVSSEAGPSSFHVVSNNDVVSQDQDFDDTDSPPLRRSIWGTHKGLRNLSGTVSSEAGPSSFHVASNNDVVTADHVDFDGSDSPPLRRSIWGTHKGFRSLSGTVSSEAGPSSYHPASTSTASSILPQPGPSGVQALLRTSFTCMQNRPDSNTNFQLAGPSISKVRHQESDSSNMDYGENDHSENSHPLRTRSRGRVQIVLSEGEAESRCEASSTLRGHVLTPMNSPRTPVDNYIVSSSTGIDSIPPTPAEFQGNDVSNPCSPVSPSLGGVAILDSTIDSTSGREVMDAENCHASSTPNTSHIELPILVSEAQEISTSQVSLQNDDSQDVSLVINSQGMFGGSRRGAANTPSHIELPILVSEAQEISTSQVNLQNDDSQDVSLVVNSQGMFAGTRSSNFIEHLSLSLSHFSANAIGVNDLSSNASSSYLDPLSTPGPSRVSLPCTSETINSHIDPTARHSINQPSITSTDNIPDPVLDSSLPLLDITSGLSECGTVSPGLSNTARSDELQGVMSMDEASDATGGSKSEMDPLVSLVDCGKSPAAGSKSRDRSEMGPSYVLELPNDVTGRSKNEMDPLVSLVECGKITKGTRSKSRDCNEMGPSYVLELPNDATGQSKSEIDPLVSLVECPKNATTSSKSRDHNEMGPAYVLELPGDIQPESDPLNSGCDKNELVNVTSKEQVYKSAVTSHQSMVSEVKTGDPLNSLVPITCQPSKMSQDASPMPGNSQDQTTTQHLLNSQTNQVSLLVGGGGGGGGDNNEESLLMMVNTHQHSMQNIHKLGKSQDKKGSKTLSECFDASPFENNSYNGGGSGGEVPPHSSPSRMTEFSKVDKMITAATHTDQKDVKAEFIGPDFCFVDSREVVSNSDCCQPEQHYHVQAISDKPVLARAWASLPAQHLTIRKITGTEELGVFTRKVIPNRTRFGPLEGVMREATPDANIVSFSGITYTIFTDEETYYVDITDEGSSNWMRFVRRATNYLEQNCVVMQIDGFLMFFTTTDIPPRTELRVGYSNQYAKERNLPCLQPTQQEISELESLRKSWQCYECDEGFESSAELQQHLTSHDEIVKDDENKKRKRLKTRRPRSSGEAADTSTKRSVKRVKTSVEETPSPASSQSGVKSPGGVVDGSKTDDLRHHNHQCKICNRAFSMPQLLKIHHIIHQSVEVKEEYDGISLKEECRTCPQCLKIFESEVELSSHVEEHSLPLPSPTKPYKCQYCYKSFLRRDRLEAHTVVHGNESQKPFQCNLCQRRFCSNSALNTHIKFHVEGSKGYDCPICREGFFSVASLKVHVTTHCVNGQFKCPTCNKVFPTYSKIRRHIRSYHAILPHTCTLCSKEMPSMDKLKIHMLSHSDRRDYLCQDCGKRFKRKDKLREHSKRMHSTDRDVRVAAKTVNKAPPKFVPKMDPTDYMQFDYKCHTCLLGFKRRGMLVNHLAKRHPNVDMTSVPELNQPIIKATRCYYCQYCEKMYRSSSKRKLHILKYHPGEELPTVSSSHKESKGAEDSTYSQTVGTVTTYPHPCKWCYRQYASRARLLRHQRHQHPEVNTDSSFVKEYDKDTPEPGVNEMDPLLDRTGGLTEDMSLNQIEGNLMSNEVGNIPREPSASVQNSEDDLLTQAMGEITPIGSEEQYVRLIRSTGEGGTQVVVGTSQGSRQILVNGDRGQQGTTLALVTADNADTVTLSLPAGQFISLLPSLSVPGPGSVVSDGREVSEGESPHVDVGTQSRTTNQELHGEILSSIRMDPSLNQEETVEQVVLTTHQSPNSMVWQQTLGFTDTTT